MNQIEESKGQITKMILPSDPSKYLCDPITNTIALCNKFTSELYPYEKLVRDTNIRNGSQLVFF